MKVVAIHLGHNATAAISAAGEILGVLSQEKMDNVKNSAAFPADAVNQLFREHGWASDEVDQIVMAGNELYPSAAYQYLFESGNEQHSRPIMGILRRLKTSAIGRYMPLPFKLLSSYRMRQLTKRGANELEFALEALGLVKVPRIHVEHHLCHARSAFHSLGGDISGLPALIFTLDGSGDGICATVTKVDEKGVFERLSATPASASLGGIYSNTTKFLGMKILEHEYKVMGLAPYAKQSYMLDTYERIFKKTIWLSSERPLEFESAIDTSAFYHYLAKTAVGERFDNLAAALQHLTEELVVEWIQRAMTITGIRRIYTGGGVFMNVKLNRRIQEISGLECVGFMPSCGDESNPIGACYDFAISQGQNPLPLRNLYLGVSYSDSEIHALLQRDGLAEKYMIEHVPDMEDRISCLLSQREIVARFAGRCEWGARSLGNRAILAHPSHMESFYTVNDYIKSRDFWMPFAPSIIDTAAPKYLQGYDPSLVKAPHMITAFSATELGVQHLRAALHQGDHTLRPQVVEQADSPDYYRLIKCFEQKTGVGAVLNTSFNLHGYPLVATPEQALFTLEKSGLKHLALGNYLISKKI